MPYKDPERKRQQMAEWRKRKMAEGYGRALYSRRKLRYEGEAALREALSEIVAVLGEKPTSYEDIDLLTHRGQKIRQAREIANRALMAYPEVVQTPLHFMPNQVQEPGPDKGEDDEGNHSPEE